ncbi:MAG: hypothetical protein ABSF60_14915 [Verrucomicrobiota bacterium]
MANKYATRWGQVITGSPIIFRLSSHAVFCYFDFMSDKELVVDLLKRLPADAKLRDIGREIEFLAAVREGEEQADRGEVVLHDQVKREFFSWITK